MMLPFLPRISQKTFAQNKQKSVGVIMKKVVLIFGTRPEAIKMCPLVRALQARGTFDTRVCLTGQHCEMMGGLLETFSVHADCDLSAMRKGQSLSLLFSRVHSGVYAYLAREKPHAVFVHGDTLSAYAAALAAFYLSIPVLHVEAGLRTGDLSSPFPEELHRRSIALLSYADFAPSAAACAHLRAEGKRERVFCVGNTVTDALSYTVRADFSHPLLDFAEGRRLILLTAHRRESIGKPMRECFRALKDVLREHENVCVIYPVHLNPEVRRIAYGELAKAKNVRLCEPFDVCTFHNILARSYIALTDSGGIQEEAPALSVPALVLRSRSEREEELSSGCVRLIGTSYASVKRGLSLLLEDDSLHSRMCAREGEPQPSPSARIAEITEKLL